MQILFIEMFIGSISYKMNINLYNIYVGVETDISTHRLLTRGQLRRHTMCKNKKKGLGLQGRKHKSFSSNNPCVYTRDCRWGRLSPKAVESLLSQSSWRRLIVGNKRHIRRKISSDLFS